MKLVHMVEPDFPEASIDIVTTDKQNLWVSMFVHTKLTYSESRIELPLWMLSTESVHAKFKSLTDFLCEGNMSVATCLCTFIHANLIRR